MKIAGASKHFSDSLPQLRRPVRHQRERIATALWVESIHQKALAIARHVIIAKGQVLHGDLKEQMNWRVSTM